MSNLNVKGIKHPSSTETNIALLTDGTLGGSAGFNWIINGAFQINQRSGTRTPGVGVYGFDRWKGHANGLEQVIESLPAGEYTLSWTGGGTGTFGGVTSASPVTATVAGGNTSVVVPSTADEVVLVAGPEAGAYQQRPIGTELALCQRYYQKLDTSIRGFQVTRSTGNNARYNTVPRTVTMRATPTEAGTVNNGTLAFTSNPETISFSINGVGDAETGTLSDYTADAEL